MTDSLPLLETEIRSLLDNPSDGERASRNLAEKTLTDGYAHALQIGGERLRVEEQLRSVVRAPKSDRAQIAELTGVLDELDRELAGLHRLLAALRAHAL